MPVIFTPLLNSTLICRHQKGTVHQIIGGGGGVNKLYNDKFGVKQTNKQFNKSNTNNKDSKSWHGQQMQPIIHFLKVLYIFLNWFHAGIISVIHLFLMVQVLSIFSRIYALQ